MDANVALALCLYIATSAVGLRTEPKEYGPVRLMEILSRLAEAAAQETGDPFLAQLAGEAAAKTAWIMTDRDAFDRYVDSLVILLVRESKRRR